jgi:cytochrome P450
MESQTAPTLLDPEIQKCPYRTYDYLRDEHPVYLDPKANLYVVTRYDDVQKVMLDPGTFSSFMHVENMRDMVLGERAQRMRDVYAAKGWKRFDGSVGGTDDPVHREIRKRFDVAFNPSRIREFDPVVRAAAYELINSFADDGHCEIVRQLATPLPTRMICKLVGAPEEAVPIIERCVAATVAKLHLTSTEEEELEHVNTEIAAQHYFKSMIDELREHPTDTVLSDLVNQPKADGTMTSDGQLLTHLLDDIFLAGVETSGHVIASGVLLLCEHPQVQNLIRADPEKHMRKFIEEVLRIESPVQGIYRRATRDVTLDGVNIPAGAMVLARFGSANRDPRKYPNPEKFDIERTKPALHFAFGQGIHACIGSPLARRELHWAFTALLERCENIRLRKGEVPAYEPSIIFRALKTVAIEFDPRSPTASPGPA